MYRYHIGATLTSYRQAMSFGLSHFKKHHPSQNLQFNNVVTFQSLKLRILVEKNPFNFSYPEFHTKYFGLLWVKCPSVIRAWASVHISRA